MKRNGSSPWRRAWHPTNAQQAGYTLQAGERRVPDLIWSWADAAAGRTRAACKEKLSLPGKPRCSVPGTVG